ncbi:MAG TPA: hypothetical protein VHN78_02260, partial [Chloroflexota bacterium]|nr:hypothetical protein [Chloroflexota bacterium]
EEVRRLLIEGATTEATGPEHADHAYAASPANSPSTAERGDSAPPAPAVQGNEETPRRQRRGGHRRTAPASPGRFW